MHTAQAHHKQKHHFVYALPGIFFSFLREKCDLCAWMCEWVSVRIPKPYHTVASATLLLPCSFHWMSVNRAFSIIMFRKLLFFFCFFFDYSYEVGFCKCTYKRVRISSFLFLFYQWQSTNWKSKCWTYYRYTSVNERTPIDKQSECITSGNHAINQFRSFLRL